MTLPDELYVLVRKADGEMVDCEGYLDVEDAKTAYREYTGMSVDDFLLETQELGTDPNVLLGGLEQTHILTVPIASRPVGRARAVSDAA